MLVTGLHLLVAALLVLAVVQAPWSRPAEARLTTVVVLAFAAVYAAGSRRGRRPARWWLPTLVLAWILVTAVSVQGVWLMFPLSFLFLHLLPRRAGIPLVLVSAGVAVAGFALHEGRFSAAMVPGPLLGAAVAVGVVEGYRALYREGEANRRLLEQLRATQEDLAEAQHAAGVAAERERLAREIHDTLAQGFISIQLLLRAAERELPGSPDLARAHVEQARASAADNLAEARRFVAGLTPPALAEGTLVEALSTLCRTVSQRHGLRARFHLDGEPVRLPPTHEATLWRVAQTAVGNTVAHAAARNLDVTLSFLGDEVAVDVVDDGVGFDPSARRADPGDGTGFGLRSARDRAVVLGGSVEVGAAPGHGVALAIRLPLGRVGRGGAA
ncbi:sensor histidine kinase [Kineococcus gynurae]|uniref:Oxygen sensor histidine kinase NreB n=1 Tax=Kineococcus gynurae TaxID=452979 RepID=A0ABV5LU53_9ACTN